MCLVRKFQSEELNPNRGTNGRFEYTNFTTATGPCAFRSLWGLGAGEKIPVHLDIGHYLIALETGVWDRYDARGCFAHTHGAGDFMSNYVIEIPPGKKTRPIKHTYEALFLVLTGYGSASIGSPGARSEALNGAPSLFVVPLNCRYQFFNASGLDSTRISCTHNAPLVLNFYHNVGYVFDNPYEFPERVRGLEPFRG